MPLLFAHSRFASIQDLVVPSVLELILLDLTITVLGVVHLYPHIIHMPISCSAVVEHCCVSEAGIWHHVECAISVVNLDACIA